MALRSPSYRTHQPPERQQEINRLYREIGVASQNVRQRIADQPGALEPIDGKPVRFWFAFLDIEQQVPGGDHEFGCPLFRVPDDNAFMVLDAHVQYLSHGSPPAGGDGWSICVPEFKRFVRAGWYRGWPGYSAIAREQAYFYRWQGLDQPNYGPQEYAYKWIPTYSMSTPAWTAVGLKLHVVKFYQCLKAVCWGRYIIYPNIGTSYRPPSMDEPWMDTVDPTPEPDAGGG